MGRLSNAVGLTKRVFAEFSEKNVTFIAAGLAYNAFISLAPMLLLLFLILSAVGGGLEQRVVESAGTWMPGPISEVVEGLFEDDSSLGGASVIGVVVLIWGTLKIFRGLDTAFSEIYETEDDNSFADKLRDGLVVFGALVVALVATVGTSAAVAVVSNTVPLVGALSPVVLFFGLVLAFFPMYYVFPDADVGVKDVLPGVVFAAVGWAAFQGLFQVYLAFQDPGTGSFFGGVIVVVTYLYFSALVLLLGAVINAVIGDHSSGEPGGVGRAAAGRDVDREESLNGDELDAYLRTLRSDLTGYDGRLRVGVDERHLPPDGGRRYPRPDGDVEVIERSADDEDDDRGWTVTLRWEAAAESGSGRADEPDIRPADD